MTLITHYALRKVSDSHMTWVIIGHLLDQRQLNMVFGEYACPVLLDVNHLELVTLLSLDEILDFSEQQISAFRKVDQQSSARKPDYSKLITEFWQQQHQAPLFGLADVACSAERATKSPAKKRKAALSQLEQDDSSSIEILPAKPVAASPTSIQFQKLTPTRIKITFAKQARAASPAQQQPALFARASLSEPARHAATTHSLKSRNSS